MRCSGHQRPEGDRMVSAFVPRTRVGARSPARGGAPGKAVAGDLLSLRARAQLQPGWLGSAQPC